MPKLFKNIFLLIILATAFYINGDNNKHDIQEDHKAIQEKIKSDENTIKPKINTKNQAVEINFENANLKTFLNFIENVFSVTFILPKEIGGAAKPRVGNQPQQKKVEDSKINYRSFSPMSEKQIWALLDIFLENSGYARVAQKNIGKNVYKIITLPQSNRSAIPTYIGSELEELPNSGRIRYVYFVQNSTIQQIQDLVNKIKSSSAQTEVFQNLKAIIITDGAYNIKSIIKLIKEIDTSSTPEVLSILKLQNAEASDVASLYDKLRGKDEPYKAQFGQKKEGSFYFPQDAKVIAELRTNSLVVLGTRDAVYRIEDFISKYLDTKLKKLPSPIHVYELNYAPAEQLAEILNNVCKFGQDSAEKTAAEFGGVRGGQKYFSKMFVEADKQGNRLLIRGSDEDFKLIKPTIAELDRRQPQVVIEVLIVNITLNKEKAIQSALRNKNSSRVNFQTSGFYGSGIQVDSSASEYTGILFTNLINLATAAVQGSTVISLGKESVWALLSSLETMTEVNVISNPFLVATNKYKAQVALGSTRRVTSGTVIGGNAQQQNELSSFSANLEVNITPQINSFGIINLDIEVKIEEFTDADQSSGNKSNKIVKTNANVADGEILALGGLIKNRNQKAQSEVPLLGRIPIIGYFFKNKDDQTLNDNLLIFMAPKIVSPQQNKIGSYTQKKADFVRGMLCETEQQEVQRDPIYQWWFKEKYDQPCEQLNALVIPQRNVKEVKDVQMPVESAKIIKQEIPRVDKHFSLVKPVNNGDENV